MRISIKIIIERYAKYKWEEIERYIGVALKII